ncbi:tryptophan synthase beta subunit-like PLP-dependent enzyme [Backusella circina FSU 941]|nr:tryptophan synthase beta subunit-like PLP-dependent enzyme [Backusella circina FSU 941]
MTTVEKILQASERINVHRTPVLTSATLNSLASSESSVELFFKCELLQKTGSFKFRGASNAIALLEEKEKGVVTHSSGNHAQALALAAKTAGIPAYVVMPSNSPLVKKEAVKGYGAEVIECEPTLEARERTANEVIERTGAAFIHPYNNPDVIAGQGTIVLELLSQVNDLDAIIIPVGGGGMLTGCTVAAKSLKPDIKVFAAEPELVNDCYRSFKNKEHSTNPQGTRSVADGLLTNLGELAFKNIQNIDDVFTVSEQDIIRSMKLIWSRMKLCIEPSAAVGVAVALSDEFQKTAKEQGLKRIGVVLCGGNVDIGTAIELFNKYD